MNEVSITRKIYEYFDEIEYTGVRQNILLYMDNHNISNFGFSTKTKHKLNFKNQIGGEIYDVKLKDNNTYYYNIEEIKPKGKTKYKILFLTFDSINECACLTFGNKESNNNVLKIDGIKSFDNCILCKNKNNVFKTGDILMQIIINLVKTNHELSHIDKIELADMSQKKCYDISLKLVYLRTMTDGIQYYAKFGFRPVLQTDYDIFRYNRANHKLNKKIKKNELLDLISKCKINMSEETYDAYNKYIKKHILNNEIIDPVIFMKQTIKIADNSIAENKNPKILILDDKKKLMAICDFISKIYIKVYNFLGYKHYDENLWELTINRKK
jgi:hypothetical protein